MSVQTFTAAAFLCGIALLGAVSAESDPTHWATRHDASNASGFQVQQIAIPMELLVMLPTYSINTA